jgi:hypothetical protein
LNVVDLPGKNQPTAAIWLKLGGNRDALVDIEQLDTDMAALTDRVENESLL